MRVRVEVRVKGLGRAAEAAAAALRPDDRTAPPWMSIEERVEDGDLVVRVEGEAAEPYRLGSVRNTVDEILEYTYSLLKTLEELLAAKTLKQPRRSLQRG